jgi:large subunit ribosomal protein L25
MEGISLKATTREVLGKKTKTLRRQGITPTHLFGHSLKSLALQCNTSELQHTIAQAGTASLFNLEIDTEQQPRKVLIREIQRDPLGKQLLHVDFYQVRMTEKIKADIPLVLVGEAPAMKLKGRLLVHPLTSLGIECLPDKLPSEIMVNLSSLEEVEQAIHVKDLTLDPDIVVSNDPDQLVVKVSEARVERVEEVVAEEAVAEEAEAVAEEKPAGEEAAETPSD